MDVLHRYMWLIVGTLLLSILMVFIFIIIAIIINKCISSSGKPTLPLLHREQPMLRSNKYTVRDKTPPLPPRIHYKTTVSESYENMKTSYQEPHYSEVDVLRGGACATRSYESFLVSQQSLDEQADYVKVEDSSADYDDVGVDDDGDEDYDDVG